MVDTLKLLEELISIPSVNPAFLPLNHPLAGESRIADYLVSLGRKAGLKPEWQPVNRNRRNLLLRLPSAKQKRHAVWLAPHMDTVAATSEQLRPMRRGDKLFGRGACDTKGAMAAMFGAMCDIAAHQPPHHTEIVLTALVDEENAQLGSRMLAKSGLKADLAIVGEPTQNQVVTAHKGNLWISLETRGRAAHGSRPELGRNAVHEMARVVHVLESVYAAKLKKRKHPLLGNATVSVGQIHGGTQPNIVPDRCVIQVDRRTLPGETERGVFREIKQLLRLHGLAPVISMFRPEECLAMETDPGLEWVRLLLRSARQPRPQGVHYFCDASILSRGGIPSLVFGPGDIAQAHTSDEWISVKSLEKGRKILREFLLALP